MFNFTIVRNGRLDDCWMQWKLPSRSSPLAPRCPIDIHQPTPQTQSDHPGCVRRWNVSEPSVFLSCFFGGWVFVSFLFVQFEPCRKWSFLAWVILVMQWKQMDIASVASIARTIWIRDPECFILFCFSVYFSVGRFFMAFWCCCFPMSFPYYRFEHIHWTFRRSSPGTLGRDSLPASASNGEEALSIPVSGCEKLREKRFCISQQGAEQNRDMNCWCWKPYKNRKVLMEKILWAPVHRVQILMHELPTLLYSNHKCLTIGFNVQVMSALMPIVLLKVRKPPKKQTDDGCKSLIRLKKTLWQVGEFVSFTLFVTESSPSIYLKKSPAEMMEREDAPESNSAISAWSQGTTSDSWGDLEPVRQPLKKKNSQLKKPWVSRKNATRLGFGCGGLGIHLLNRCLSSVDPLKLQRPTNHPWHPKVFLDFCLVNSFFSYRKSIWMATRLLGMSVYLCHHDLGRHPRFPNQNQAVTELCLASVANMLWTSLRWKSFISFNGIRTSTNHGGILHSHAMRHYCEIEWL